ncbi:heme biosynthesis HemY N-terminal domain-containing protein [Hahella sp. SMD15-11]|uniref:Heme biosynthesis HemY N-terminal domain-containing protein n=1 Tax=Thermohahella caldifontis TaxID=3142973 RepID=A0AB39USU0_9GAMM
MIRLIIVLVIALSLGVGLGLLIVEDAGYVRISWQNWLLETNVWIGGALLILGYIGLALIWKAVRRFLGLRTDLGRWLNDAGSERARRRTVKGLIAYAEGDWKRALRLLSRAAPLSDTPLINYLAAAQCAQELGQYDEADRLLNAALESTPGAEVAVGVTQARLLHARNQMEACLSTLKRLREIRPRHPLVLQLLAEVHERLEDWSQLVGLIPELEKTRVVPQEKLRDLERRAWVGRFEAEGEKLARQQGASRTAEPLNQLWDALPSHLREDDAVVDAAVRQWVRLGEADMAERILRKVLRRRWSARLVREYGILPTSEPKEQLLCAENWLKERPADPDLLLTLGRLCLRNQLWGRAREYFEAALKQRRDTETLFELGRLDAHLGKPEAACKVLLSAIGDSVKLPELPQPSR